MLDDGCRSLGCKITPEIIQADIDRDMKFKQETERNAHRQKCEQGDENYCSTVKKHPFAVTTFVATGLLGGPIIEEYLLGGSAATVMPNIAENGLRQLIVMCLKIPMCARSIGAGTGVTVLGKIINGENPPGYVKIGQDVGGRWLYVESGFSPEMQQQFWSETKALGQPILLANDFTKYAGSTFEAEVTDLLQSGWKMILNVLMYPPSS
jgi:hypothetical protein